MSVDTIDPFKQSLLTMLTQEEFQANDFIDINAVNQKGMSVLHIAAVLDDSKIVKQLVASGANPLIVDNANQTPLRKATQIKATEATKALVSHALQDYPDAMTHSGMTLFKQKGDGVTLGGFYKDANNQGWLVKEGHYSTPKSVINEYVSGGLYQVILGDYAPKTELVYDDSHAQLLLGSKLIQGFNQLNDYFPYGHAVLTTINGKPIEGLIDVVSAIIFLNDTDGHRGNVGIVEVDGGYHFAKVDHGFSLDFTWNTEHLTLDHLRYELRGNYDIDNLETIGFDTVYHSILKIAETPFETFSNVIHERLEQAKVAMTVLQLKDLNQYYDDQSEENLDLSINQYEQKLITNLQSRHEDFEKMAQYMLFEKSIIDHDLQTVLQLMDTKGFTLEDRFVPFYDSGSTDYWYTHETTGKAIAEKAWPELNGLLNSNVLSVQDVFSSHVDPLVASIHEYSQPFFDNIRDHFDRNMIVDFFA